MKAIKDIYAVPDGDIYPVKIKKGEEIPENMIEVAKQLKAVGPTKKATK